MPAAATDLNARFDELSEKHKELLKKDFPNGAATPDEQAVLDRIDQKLQELSKMCAKADASSGSDAGDAKSNKNMMGDLKGMKSSISSLLEEMKGLL